MSNPREALGAEVTTGGVLVVDDEFSVRDSLEGWFKKDGYRVASAADARDALRRLQDRSWDVVLLDIRMPGMDGLELQRRIHEIDAGMAVIMITAFASVDTAVQALKDGAFDYVTKPIDPDELSRLVRRAVEQRRRGAEGPGAESDDPTEPIVAESAAMRRVLDSARVVAESDVSVTICGESGAGRQRLARFIHERSQRRNFPFVPVPCGAFTDDELEGELYGHERLALAGARVGRKGKLEMVEGGTLLLAEIERIGPRMQVELLRTLERGEFRRLGGTAPVRADFRVLAATSGSAEQLVRERRLREDLYFRLGVFSIVVPPLRERREDIPELARQLLARSARQMNRPFRELEPRALDALARHDWPGNVRELACAIEHAVVIGTPPTLRAADLPDSVR